MVYEVFVEMPLKTCVFIFCQIFKNLIINWIFVAQKYFLFDEMSY